jgi:hypothetical protein
VECQEDEESDRERVVVDRLDLAIVHVALAVAEWRQGRNRPEDALEEDEREVPVT